MTYTDHFARRLHAAFDGTALAGNTGIIDQVIWRIMTEIEHAGVPISEIMDGEVELGDDLKLHMRQRTEMLALSAAAATV